MKKLLTLLLCAALLTCALPALAAGEEPETGEESDPGELAGLSITWMDGCELVPDPNAAGLLVARTDRGEGLIDPSGREVLPCVYDAVSFSPDALVSIQKDGRYGIASGAGEVMIPAEYAELIPISRGWPMVAQKEPGGLYGAVDLQGREVIPSAYDSIQYFWEYDNGYTLAVKDGRQGVLDQYGQFAVPDLAQYGEVVSRSPDGSRLVVQKDGAYAVVDQNGMVIVPFGTYPYIDSFGVCGAAVLHPEVVYTYGEPDFMTWGAVGYDGALIVPTEYRKVWPVAEGFLVYDGSNCGLFSGTGEVLIPCTYQVEVMYHGGDYRPPTLDALKAAAGWLEEAPAGETPVWAADYDFFQQDWHEGLSIVGKRDGDALRYGFMDETGAPAVPCVFDQVWNFKDGYAIVTLDGVDGLLKNPLKADAVSDWAADEVARARAAGLVTARTGSYWTYPVTRLQFAELAANLVERATGTELEPAAADRFADTGDLWVRKAAQAGIVNGVGDGGAFDPDRFVTREQIAAMLYRAVDYIYEAEHGAPLIPEKADLSAYADAPEVSGWAVQPVSALARLGSMQGSGGKLSPQADTTVEQAILLILRAAG